jgi:hypothetical protein
LKGRGVATTSIRLIHVALIVVFVTAQISVRPVFASMVGTDSVVGGPAASEARDQLRAFLAREDVRAQMEVLGVSPEEAEARVASLSDEEVLRIGARLDELPAGGSFAGLMLTVTLVLLLIFVITDLIGWTDVFTFIDPPGRPASR